jgi:hypothetical protein
MLGIFSCSSRSCCSTLASSVSLSGMRSFVILDSVIKVSRAAGSRSLPMLFAIWFWR